MRDAGFTLLELLVGLVVLSFILAGLSQSVRFGLRAGESQTRQSEGRSELDGIDRTLRRLIEQADPGTPQSGPPLQGGIGTIGFTSELPEAAADRHADIALGMDGRRTLVLRWSPHRHVVQAGPPPAAHEIALLRGIAGVQIGYWKDGWRTQWNEASLPALIRLRILFPPGDPRHWPDIVVAPQRQKTGGPS